MGFKTLFLLTCMLWGGIGCVMALKSESQVVAEAAAEFQKVAALEEIVDQAAALKSFMEQAAGNVYVGGVQNAFSGALTKFVRDAQALVSRVLSAAKTTPLLMSNQQAYVDQTMLAAVKKVADTVPQQ